MVIRLQYREESLSEAVEVVATRRFQVNGVSEGAPQAADVGEDAFLLLLFWLWLKRCRDNGRDLRPYLKGLWEVTGLSGICSE